MSETTQTERDGARRTAEMSEAQQVGMATTGEFMLRLLGDADRPDEIERKIRELADEIVKALREAKAVRLMIAEQDNIEAYTDDLDDIISRLEAKEALGDT